MTGGGCWKNSVKCQSCHTLLCMISHQSEAWQAGKFLGSKCWGFHLNWIRGSYILNWVSHWNQWTPLLGDHSLPNWKAAPSNNWKICSVLKWFYMAFQMLWAHMFSQCFPTAALHSPRGWNKVPEEGVFVTVPSWLPKVFTVCSSLDHKYFVPGKRSFIGNFRTRGNVMNVDHLVTKSVQMLEM